MTDELEIRYSTGGTLAADAKSIIDAARSAAYRSVNVALVRRNWLLGRRIAEEVLKGEGRAEYGCTLSLVPGPLGARGRYCRIILDGETKQWFHPLW